MNREIKYDRETRDYACYIDGELIGFAKSYHDGEVVCDQYVYDELARAEPVTFVASRDEAHRQERWVNILSQIAGMSEPDKDEAITFALQTIESIVGRRAIVSAAA
jgi:hypothetical protein